MTMSQALRALVIEDSEDDALMLARELRHEFNPLQFERVEDATAFEAALEAQAWDVVIADYSLPRFGALEALQLFCRHGLDTPFVVVSGTVGEDTAVATMKAGANDYVMKSNLARLGPAIQRELREAVSRRARRSAEKDLARSVSLLIATLEATADAIIGIDEERNSITTWNHKFIELWGLAEDEMERFRENREGLIARLQSLVEDPSLLVQRRAEIYRDQPGASFDELQLKNGRILAIYSFPQQVEGRNVGRVWSFRDITRRKQMEKELRNSEQRYRLLFERNLAGVVRSTPDGALLDCNAAFTRMLGYDSIEEVKAQPVIQFYEKPAERDRLLEQLRRHGYIVNYETCLRGKGGRQVLFLENATLVRDPDEGREVIETTLIDITEYRRVSEELRQSQKLNAIGQLAGGIAHDFNNLLTVILGNADRLTSANNGDAATLSRRVQAIQDAGQRAASMTRQLLLFSRKQPITMQVIDMNLLIRQMTELLHRLLPSQNVELVTALAPGKTKIKADASQFEQVLLNLAVNARDAMPQGGQLSLKTSLAEIGAGSLTHPPSIRPGSYVLLQVSDTGTGMDAETQQHIFEPFFTTKGPGQGTGLGLATVYGIISQIGGHINVESSVGKGTTFNIYCPLAADEIRSEAPASTPAMPQATKAETVLVVEDQLPVRELLVEILRDRGYTVLEAGNGAQALTICREYKTAVHLVITDMMMPEMNGVELTKRLMEVRPGLRVIFISGYTKTDQPLPPDAVYLTKPFTSDQMEAAIQKTRQAAFSRRDDGKA